MFTDQLYDHKFDIDDIIFALCADNNNSHFFLDTQNKRLLKKKPPGVKEDHLFTIEPLPSSFLDEIKQNYKFSLLEKQEQKEISYLLEQIQHMHELPSLFDTGYAGGWIRERIKEVALEWLDLHNLIPPSMRHVRDSSMFESLPTPGTKVKVDLN